TASELIGQPRHILQDRRAQRKLLNRICRDLAAGKVCNVQLVQRGKEGKPYDAELSITPLVDRRHGLTTFVSVHRDVTERNKAEAELDRYRKDLRVMSFELMLAEEKERQRLAEQLH